MCTHIWFMRRRVPEAGIKGRDKLLHPTDTTRCNYLSLPQGWGTRTRYSYSQCSSTEFNSCTRTLLVLVSSKVIVLVPVIVLIDKYSGTHLSAGPSTDILCCICDIRVKTITPVKQFDFYMEKFQIDLFCYDMNIWYRGCDFIFHNFLKYYHHRKVNWINIMKSSTQIHFPIQLLVNVWKFYFRLKRHYFPHIS